MTNKSNVRLHILNTRIRQLPGSGRVVTAGYPDPVPGEIRYPSHLYKIVDTAAIDGLFCKLKVDDQQVMLVLWDTAGQEEYDRLRPVCYQRANVVVVCFSVDRRTSYNNVEAKWIPEVRHHCPNAAVILVATKTDLRQAPNARRPLTTDDGDELARRLGANAYAECSSKTGDGVADVFQTAAREALRAGRRSNCTRRRRCDLF